MAPPAPVSNFALKSILEKDKLNGTNFTTWYRNLRIVLKHDKKENVLEEPLPEEPADNATTTAKNAYQKLKDESTEISCLMLASMEPELQQQFEDIRAFDMIESLKGMFHVQARTKSFNVWRSLMDCKLKEGDPLSPHVMTDKCRGSIAAFSINKSVEPNEEQKVLTSDLGQGITASTER